MDDIRARRGTVGNETQDAPAIGDRNKQKGFLGCPQGGGERGTVALTVKKKKKGERKGLAVGQKPQGRKNSPRGVWSKPREESGGS